MGCWHGTCGLSGLPVISGTEMFVFPIVESIADSFCYSTALYRPSVLPFRAIYNDYGAGEDCNGIGLDLVIDGIREKLIEVEQGENRYHDIAVKREGFDVDKFFDACHKKRLQFANPMRGYENQPQTINVFFTMVRKDVVDRLWNEWKFDLWKSHLKTIPEGFEVDRYYIKNVTYANLAEFIPDYLEATFRKCADAIKESPGSRFFALTTFFERERDHILSDSFGHAFGSGYAGGGFSTISEVKERIITEYLDGDKEIAYELMRECLIGIMVNNFMEHVRKVWLPPMHQGSQSECLAEYRLMNSIINDLIAEREKVFDCDD